MNQSTVLFIACRPEKQIYTKAHYEKEISNKTIMKVEKLITNN